MEEAISNRNQIFSVRLAEPRDGSAIAALKYALQVEEGNRHTIAPNAELWIERLFGPDRQFEALVAEHNSRMVGTINISSITLSGEMAQNSASIRITLLRPPACTGGGSDVVLIQETSILQSAAIPVRFSSSQITYGSGASALNAADINIF